MSKDEKKRSVTHNFTYHAPSERRKALHVLVRQQGLELAHCIIDATPESREQSLALTNLEQAVFWANAAIARQTEEEAF